MVAYKAGMAKMTIKKALAAGWAVRIWPHYHGYTTVFSKADEVTRIGRGPSVRKAVRKAFR